MARSIATGVMPWDNVKKKILELRKKHSNKDGEWDEQDVHQDLVKWMKETPSSVNYDALAARYRDRADHEDRPFGMGQAQGNLFEAQKTSVIPYDENRRITLDLAGNRHFVGWQQILQDNYSNQAKAFLKQQSEITKVLAMFEQHRNCKNFRALRKYYSPPANEEEKGA